MGATLNECKVFYLQAASCTFLFGSRIRFNSCGLTETRKALHKPPQNASQIEECTLPVQ